MADPQQVQPERTAQGMQRVGNLDDVSNCAPNYKDIGNANSFGLCAANVFVAATQKMNEYSAKIGPYLDGSNAPICGTVLRFSVKQQ